MNWHNEAEQSVLGGLLQDNAALDRVADLLTRRDFFSAAHGRIYAAIESLVSASKPADPVTVLERLGTDAEEVGGLAYLNALEVSVPSAANIRRYAEIVREHSQHRALMETADKAMEIAAGDGAVADKIDRIAAAFGALERGQVRKMPRSLGEIFAERVDRISDLAEGQAAGWPTGFPTLDAKLNGGMRPGAVYILAARPSVGKSALAQWIGLGQARQGMPTLFLSQEMPEGEVADRALSGLGEIDYGRLQTGALNQLEWGQLAKAVDDYRGLPFHVDDQAGLTLGDIRAKARSVRGLKLLIVDYLQLSASRGGHDNRNSEIEEISRGVKQLAKDTQIAVLMLSQLNRKVEERTGKRPILSDLRDSGSIEQDADVVLLMWPIKERKAEGCMEIGMDIPKNRQGKKGGFVLNFWGDLMRWGESAYRLEDVLKKDSRVGEIE